MDVSGQWAGTIIFGERYGVHQNKKLYFDMMLSQSNETISGESVDIGGIGVSPDTATINGEIGDKGPRPWSVLSPNHHII